MSTPIPPKKRSPAETWDAIMKGADDADADAGREMDRILAMSDADLDRELAADGLDPAKVRVEGKAFADRLLGKRVADTKLVDELRRERDRLLAIRARRGKLDRSALLERIALAKTHPRLPAPLVAQFRNRGTEEATLEELESTLDALEGLLEHHDEAGADGEGKE